MDFEQVQKKKKAKILKKKGLRRFSAILVPVQNGITRNFFIYEAILKNFIPKCLSWWVLKEYLIKMGSRFRPNLPVRKYREWCAHPVLPYLQTSIFLIQNAIVFN